MDEALFFLQDSDGARCICCVNDPSEVEKCVVKSEKFREKIMVMGAISDRGVLPLVRVPQKVKISA